jgi:hypothetical protein
LRGNADDQKIIQRSGKVIAAPFADRLAAINTRMMECRNAEYFMESRLG